MAVTIHLEPKDSEQLNQFLNATGMPLKKVVEICLRKCLPSLLLSIKELERVLVSSEND